MIKVFGQNDYDSSNGDVSFIPLKALVYKSEYGDYYLDLECDLKYIDYLKAGNIVAVKLPQGEEPFRIYNPVVDGKKFTARCWHLTYDLKNYLVADNFIENKTCQYALNYLFTLSTPTAQSKFIGLSDVARYKSYRCVRKSLYEAIYDILDRWGGHLKRTQNMVIILADIEHDNGVVIQFRKNLKEITCEEVWDDVVTKILPVGKDGTLLNRVNPNASIYIESSTQYDIPFCKTVSFSQDIDKDDYPTEADYFQALVDDLRDQATKYLAEHCVPQVNYTLRANLDKITDIGDVIEVKDERLGVDLLTNVLAFEYDCIQNKYISVEFGNFKRNLSNLMSNIQKMINNSITERLNQ